MAVCTSHTCQPVHSVHVCLCLSLHPYMPVCTLCTCSLCTLYMQPLRSVHAASTPCTCSKYTTYTSTCTLHLIHIVEYTPVCTGQSVLWTDYLACDVSLFSIFIYFETLVNTSQKLFSKRNQFSLCHIMSTP
jgi:hypothetical protein